MTEIFIILSYLVVAVFVLGFILAIRDKEGVAPSFGDVLMALIWPVFLLLVAGFSLGGYER